MFEEKSNGKRWRGGSRKGAFTFGLLQARRGAVAGIARAVVRNAQDDGVSIDEFTRADELCCALRGWHVLAGTTSALSRQALRAVLSSFVARRADSSRLGRDNERERVVLRHRKNKGLCLFRVEPSEGLRETGLPGTSFPLDDTAIGQVVRFWGLNEPLFETTPPVPIFTAGARDQHTAAFATPVFGAGDKFRAALTLSGPASRLETARV